MLLLNTQPTTWSPCPSLTITHISGTFLLSPGTASAFQSVAQTQPAADKTEGTSDTLLFSMDSEMSADFATALQMQELLPSSVQVAQLDSEVEHDRNCMSADLSLCLSSLGEHIGLHLLPQGDQTMLRAYKGVRTMWSSRTL